jgi:hypothetical protein
MTQVVSLADVRAHLRMSPGYTDDDYMLQNIFIPAAQDALEGITGYTVPAQFDEYYDGGHYSIWLRNTPLLSVELVEEGWGFTNYELSYQQVNSQSAVDMYAYSIDDYESGEITRRTAGNVNTEFIPGDGNIHVVYTAGRQNTPGTVYLAALELVSYWYRNAEQRGDTGSGSNAANMQFSMSNTDFTRSQGVEAMYGGIPYGIIFLIRRHMRTPVIG